MKSKKIKLCLYAVFIFYCLILLKLLIFKLPLPQWMLSPNFIPFKTIFYYLKSSFLGSINIDSIISNLIGSIIIFIPFGALLPYIFKSLNNIRIMLIIGIITNLGIELIQLLCRNGIFDVDDIILRTLGTILGYFFYKKFSSILEQHNFFSRKN